MGRMNALLTDLPGDSLSHALGAGGLYWVLYLVVGGIIGRRGRPGVFAQMLRASVAAGYVAATLAGGLLTGEQVGLRPIGSLFNWPWLLGIAAGLGIWSATLWGIGRYVQRAGLVADRSFGEASNGLGLLLNGLFQEASLAILRASLAPLLGLYWASWAGLLLKQAADWGLGIIRRQAPQGTGVPLDHVLDWPSTALYVLSQSLYPALIGRGMGYLLMGVAHLILARIIPREAGPQPDSAED
mgnify:CR=1 FL=1